jgi:peroxiredoxin-like protein
MSEVHTYKVRSAWSGNRQGTGTINGDGLSSKFSVPNNLDGPGVGTNPEELLLGAASGCYVITLAIILSNRKVPYTRLELESEGFVVDDGGLRFDRIEHRPTIYVDQPVDHEKISLYAEQAEHACMVSSALRGNVQVTVHPQVLMEPARTT